MTAKPPPSNVVKLPKAELPPVLTGSVHSPGQRLSGSRNEVWLAPAYSGADSVMLYLKPNLPLRGMVAEMVAAQVGTAMGLPCPQPYLVSVAPHHVGRPRGRGMLCFGAEQVGPHSTATPVKDLSVMLKMLQTAKCAEGAAMLDEWIANPVRGPSDIVFDPHGGIWLIDHEGALEPQVKPDQAVTNWLADRLKQTLTLDQKAQLHKSMCAQATKARRMRLKGTPPEFAQIVGGADAYREVLQFLEDRLTHMDRLLSQRVLPEQLHLDNIAPPAIVLDQNDARRSPEL